MVIIVNSQGTALNTAPDNIYQGSNNANEIILIAPWSAGTQVTLTYQLPNGLISSTPIIMSPYADADLTDEYVGNIWFAYVGEAITQYYGDVSLQFRAVTRTNQLVATSNCTFTVLKGVAPILQPTPTPDVYSQILEALTSLSNRVYQNEQLKQDKVDTNLQTTNKTVVGAINEVNAQADTNSNNIVTINANIANLQTNKQDKTDNTLQTTNKTVVGAINEVNALASSNESDINDILDGTQKVNSAIYADDYTEDGEIKRKFDTKVDKAIYNVGSTTEVNNTGSSVSLKQFWDDAYSNVSVSSAGVELSRKGYNNDLVKLNITSQNAKITKTDILGQTTISEIATEDYVTNHFVNKVPDGTNDFFDANTKINTIYLPDEVLGALKYGGTFNESGIISASTFDPDLEGTLIDNVVLADYVGYYFIATGSYSFGGFSYLSGDYAISNGTSWAKIDNTDTVTSVNGKQGAVVLTVADIADCASQTWVNTLVGNLGTYDTVVEYVNANISSNIAANFGKQIQLDFVGSLVGNLSTGHIEFTLDPSISTFVLENLTLYNFYCRLALTTLTGDLPDTLPVLFKDKDGNDVNLNCIFQKDDSQTATVGDICSLQTYDTTIGYEWQFSGIYRQFVESGNTVRVIYTDNPIRESNPSMSGQALYTAVANAKLTAGTTVLCKSNYASNGVNYLQGHNYLVTSELVGGLLQIDVTDITASEYTDAYIVSGSTEYSAGWLSLTDGGVATTPTTRGTYLIKSTGGFYNLPYKWNGSIYQIIGAMPTPILIRDL